MQVIDQPDAVPETAERFRRGVHRDGAPRLRNRLARATAFYERTRSARRCSYRRIASIRQHSRGEGCGQPLRAGARCSQYGPLWSSSSDRSTSTWWPARRAFRSLAKPSPAIRSRLPGRQGRESGACRGACGRRGAGRRGRRRCLRRAGADRADGRRRRPSACARRRPDRRRAHPSDRLRRKRDRWWSPAPTRAPTPMTCRPHGSAIDAAGAATRGSCRCQRVPPATRAKAKGARIVLNSAPARPLPSPRSSKCSMRSSSTKPRCSPSRRSTGPASDDAAAFRQRPSRIVSAPPAIVHPGERRRGCGATGVGLSRARSPRRPGRGHHRRGRRAGRGPTLRRSIAECDLRDARCWPVGRWIAGLHRATARNRRCQRPRRISAPIAATLESRVVAIS